MAICLRAKDSARSQLMKEAWEKALAKGRKMGFEEAISYARRATYVAWTE